MYASICQKVKPPFENLSLRRVDVCARRNGRALGSLSEQKEEPDITIYTRRRVQVGICPNRTPLPRSIPDRELAPI